VFSQTATHVSLLTRIAEGADPGAWLEFCDRYSELIRGFCRARGLQAHDVDDVHQDVLLALTKRMPSFEYDPARGRFRSYLKAVVLHAIARRVFQKRGGAGLQDLHEAALAEATRVAGQDDAEAQWESEWRQHHLRTAMRVIESEFNESDRLAFVAYAIEGRSPAEVGASLGVSVDSVYQAKSRILRRLTALIDQQVGEEG
jgi:RNA polymerase sigma-70 factor (ECF subfamily)